jgi:hypothetical protein
MPCRRSLTDHRQNSSQAVVADQSVVLPGKRNPVSLIEVDPLECHGGTLSRMYTKSRHYTRQKCALPHGGVNSLALTHRYGVYAVQLGRWRWPAVGWNHRSAARTRGTVLQGIMSRRFMGRSNWSATSWPRPVASRPDAGSAVVEAPARVPAQPVHALEDQTGGQVPGR